MNDQKKKCTLATIKRAGWASKLSAAQLAQILAYLPPIEDPDILVGTNTSDDAGVYRLNEELALVETVDILTPVTEDAYTFGMIAAANAISDIYAMGGDPKLALNIVGYPRAGNLTTLGEMLKGGFDKSKEAGVAIIGGHSFASDEVRYGLSVVGYIKPDRIITNAGAKQDDVIILTKPVGGGTIIQSVIIGKDQGIDVKSVLDSMTTLNRDASIAMRSAGAHAATDVTGFGLIGHLVELAKASKTGIELSLSKIPIHKGALQIIKQGILEPGIKMNMDSFSDRINKAEGDPDLIKLIFGSETSGGLIVVLPENKVEQFKKEYPQNAAVIGRVTAENKGHITITH